MACGWGMVLRDTSPPHHFLSPASCGEPTTSLSLGCTLLFPLRSFQSFKFGGLICPLQSQHSLAASNDADHSACSHSNNDHITKELQYNAPERTYLIL